MSCSGFSSGINDFVDLNLNAKLDDSPFEDPLNFSFDGQKIYPFSFWNRCKFSIRPTLTSYSSLESIPLEAWLK